MSFFKKKKKQSEVEELSAAQKEILKEEKEDMIEGVEGLSETAVKEVMVPRIDVDFISDQTPRDELLEAWGAE